MEEFPNNEGVNNQDDIEMKAADNNKNDDDGLIENAQNEEEDKKDEGDIKEAEDNNNDNINIENEQQKAENQQNNVSNKKERNSLIRLPLAKIKNIMKLDNDIKLCQKNAYLVIGKLTELFLKEIAGESEKICKMSKRKTINLDDITHAVERNDKYIFIDIPSIFHVEMIQKRPQNKKEKTRTKPKDGQNQDTNTDANNNAEDNNNLENNSNDLANKNQDKNKGKGKKNKKDSNVVTNNWTIESMFAKK